MPRFRGRTPSDVPPIPWQDCVAKTKVDGNPGISVFEHCCNVAEVAKALCELQTPSVKKLLGDDAVTLAAIHDIGKISPGFQKRIMGSKLTELAPALTRIPASEFATNHAHIGAATVNRFLGARFKSSTASQVVGLHHGGLRERIICDDNAGIFGGGTWARERTALLKKMLARYGNLSPNAVEPHVRNLLAGLVTVADWIASDEHFFSPAGLPDDVDRVHQARKAVQECGFLLPDVVPNLSFQEIFSFPPYRLQEQFEDIVSGPGLYVLEAPMGMGKTEAALYAAYKLMLSGDNQGLYFGLPTRLTSDRIHKRVTSFLQHVFSDDTFPKLAHGTAWLKVFEHGGEEFRAGSAWSNSRKRKLLYPFAVGTIDQALLSIIRVNHFFVRSLALAGKVVILDEVHSYDIYTGTLMEEMIDQLLSLGCTVIVLSATLTRKRRASLFQSTQKTIQQPQKTRSHDHYPLVSWNINGRRGSFPGISLGSQDYSINMVNWDSAEVAETAINRAESGHCVLCIANSVAQAQLWYNSMAAQREGSQFPLGLLHSKFPNFRRDKLEKEWLQKLGKNGSRPSGCILVATQVVEQSVDIDADALITELAPTDMILQRMGRQWRHQRDSRPSAIPETIIVTGDLTKSETTEEIVDGLGRINSLIYAPYVLWKSLMVWTAREKVVLPEDVRSLLEATYRRDLRSEPESVRELYGLFQTIREKLRQLAEAAKASVTSLPTGEDREGVATRYSDFPTSRALLVREVDSTGRKAILKLLNGSVVETDADRTNFRVTAELHKNTVSIATYMFEQFDMVRKAGYLQRHFYEPTPVLLWREESGELYLDGSKTRLSYTPTCGIRVEKKNTPRSSAPSALANTEYDGFDVFDKSRFDW